MVGLRAALGTYWQNLGDSGTRMDFIRGYTLCLFNDWKWRMPLRGPWKDEEGSQGLSHVPEGWPPQGNQGWAGTGWV